MVQDIILSTSRIFGETHAPQNRLQPVGQANLIAHIEKLEKRKKYGLVWDIQIRPDPARHPLRAGGLGLAEETELNE